jgi:hypothetical protein
MAHTAVTWAQSAVVKQNVNLREGPSSNTTLKETLYPNDELTLLTGDTVNKYLEARVASGLKGWVYAPRIRVIDSPAGPGEIYRGCSLEGNAQTEARRELNRLKNRITAPHDSVVDSSATLQALLAPGDDTNRWDTERGAVLTGFVIDIKKGGTETVNCGESVELYRDTHIELVLQQGITSKKQRVIVEVTPRWRDFMNQQGQDWTTPTLRTQLLGKRVRFTGWLFFDGEHDDEAENTRPGRPENWRATAWEIHPVTRIQIIPE